MVTKRSLAFLALFAFIFIIGIGSATLTIPSSVPLSDFDFQENIAVTNTNSSFNYTFNQISFTIEAPQGNIISFQIDGMKSLNGSSSTNLILNNVTPLDFSLFDLGERYSKVVNITGNKYSLNATDNSTIVEVFNNEITIILERNNYCKYGNKGNLIDIVDVEDDDDFEWGPLQDIEIEVEVENNDDSDKRVIVKLALYDLDEEEFVEFEDGEDELDESVRIADDDEEVVTFNFKLPADIDPDNDYRLYIKAYEKGEEENQCNSFVEEDIEIADYEVILDELQLPQISSCGSFNTISFRVYNLDLLDEEEMRINLYSSELGLNVNSDRFELDRGDYEDVSLNFFIPEGKDIKSYGITLYAEYDYSESLDTFEDSETLGVYTIRVDGDKCKAAFVPSISGSLESETKTMVGEDLVVEIKVSNTGSNVTSFILALENYALWASSASLNESSFTLAAGESRVVAATLKPTKSGNQEFTVKTIYGTRSSEQKISIQNIEEKSGFLSRFSNSISIKGDATFWLTIAIFVVLILIILVLLVRFINSSKEE